MVNSTFEYKKSEHIQRLKNQSLQGNAILMHRSLRVLNFPAKRWVDVLVLPLVGSLMFLLIWPYLAEVWSDCLTSSLSSIFPDAEFSPYTVWFSDAPLWIPRLDAAIPGVLQWWIGLGFCLICVGLMMIRSSHWTPVRYTAGFLGVLQITSQVFFLFSTDGLPYDIFKLLASEIETAATVILMMPWLLAATFNIFPFSTWHKAKLLALSMGYLCVLTPIQFACHGVILGWGSMLWMPMLWFVFGFAISILTVIGWYSWAMSWGADKEPVIH